MHKVTSPGNAGRTEEAPEMVVDEGIPSGEHPGSRGLVCPDGSRMNHGSDEEEGGQDTQEGGCHDALPRSPKANGVIPLIHPGGADDLRTEGTHGTGPEVRITDGVGYWRDGWVSSPLLKIPLPGHLQQRD